MGLRAEFAGYGGPHDVHGTTWLTWAELDTTDWPQSVSIPAAEATGSCA
ncbi:hypothetical protein [Streptomyces sp. NBC_00354]